ncbi:MAG: hypothetical protein CFE26_12915 [Verrucomicrobiales bacterium VVV1]|nr:MAG: hypothetical protein CFE26_12915 [Verrucomicrobiales bacterium VVV1]
MKLNRSFLFAALPPHGFPCHMKTLHSLLLMIAMLALQVGAKEMAVGKLTPTSEMISFLFSAEF